MSLSWRICGLSIFITIILDNSLTLSNVGELSWSWIPRRTISNFRKGKKILSYWVVACFHVSSIRCDIRPFAHYGHEGWALSAQNKVPSLHSIVFEILKFVFLSEVAHSPFCVKLSGLKGQATLSAQGKPVMSNSINYGLRYLESLKCTFISPTKILFRT